MDKVIDFVQKKQEKLENNQPHLVMNHLPIGENLVSVVPCSLVEDYISGKIQKDEIEHFDLIMRSICFDFLQYIGYEDTLG